MEKRYGLRVKELGLNPASSTECQFKLTKHLRLLFLICDAEIDVHLVEWDKGQNE